jgi:hypothetical protein
MKMKELNSSFRHTRYIKEQGWATMPGEENPDDKVATECAQRLMPINE